MKLYIKDGIISPSIITYDNKTIINPTDDDYISAGFIEYIPTQIIDNNMLYGAYINSSDDYIENNVSSDELYIKYSELVNSYIRLKYTLSDELALIRQKKEKPDEFQQYYDYCEQCKYQAKLYLGIINEDINTDTYEYTIDELLHIINTIILDSSDSNDYKHMYYNDIKAQYQKLLLLHTDNSDIDSNIKIQTLLHDNIDDELYEPDDAEYIAQKKLNMNRYRFLQDSISYIISSDSYDNDIIHKQIDNDSDTTYMLTDEEHIIQLSTVIKEVILDPANLALLTYRRVNVISNSSDN